MKKTLLALAILLAFVTVSFPEEDNRKAELSLNVGGAFPQLDSSSNYSWGWRHLLLFDVQESGSISASAENSLFVAGSFSYFLLKNIGIQASFGYTKADVAKDVSFAFNWGGLRGRGFSRQVAFSGTGEMRVIPICLNGIVKFRFKDETLGGYLSGGYTLFSNKFNASSYMGAGSALRYRSYGEYDPQKFDAFRIPVKIDQSWGGHGANMGAGFDFKFTENLAITIDARYYYCPSKEFDWIWIPGTYPGYFYGIDELTIDSETATLLQNYFTKLEVNPSFFQISAGIKLFFEL